MKIVVEPTQFTFYCFLCRAWKRKQDTGFSQQHYVVTTPPSFCSHMLPEGIAAASIGMVSIGSLVKEITRPGLAIAITMLPCTGNPRDDISRIYELHGVAHSCSRSRSSNIHEYSCFIRSLQLFESIWYILIPLSDWILLHTAGHLAVLPIHCGGARAPC